VKLRLAAVRLAFFQFLGRGVDGLLAPGIAFRLD
jgi:hypothetical protein